MAAERQTEGEKRELFFGFFPSRQIKTRACHVHPRFCVEFILLFSVILPFARHHRADGRAADEQKRRPQGKVGIVARLRKLHGHCNRLFLQRGYRVFDSLWYRQVLCANSFTSLAELSLHRAGKPALNYLVAEDRERVKGGEAACEALDVSSVFCYQPASSSCISMCFMLMYFFPPHWVPAT